VVTLGMFTALGGGILRDILLGALPPATFSDWRYLTVAAVGSLVAFGASNALGRLAMPILVLDAAGLSLFAVSGALKALDFQMGFSQAVILGTITAVGGGTLRDVLIREVPAVLSSGLYAIPALVGALVLVGGDRIGVADLPAAVLGAAVCFAIRMLGVRFGLDAPAPPGTRRGA
jgi:uncharacterized membrane protein YeiH